MVLRAVLLLTFSVVNYTVADTPPKTVIPSETQAARDLEKLTLLQGELTEQKQKSTQLQKARAIHLANNDQDSLAQTEARLTEVLNNITQLQQEIDLAQGKTKAVAVKAVAATGYLQTPPSQPAISARIEQAGPWWDLYNRRSTSVRP